MRRTSSARLSVMLILVVILQALPGCGNSGSVSTSNSAKVTKANYDKITVGMSEAEVASILGEPGNETSASASKRDAAGVTTSQATAEKAWGDDKKSIKVTFSDGKVTLKTQQGLQ
jgi:outer membrane protein assembly factor BamE (lipoprotein component of BamABCDE complex)